MIHLEGVSKRFGDRYAVRSLSLDVGTGEVLGFLGPNGAGKTTTMRILTGYLAPTAGQVEVAGVDVVDDPLSAREHIGYLPENPPVYRDMVVCDYLDYVAALKGVARRQRRAQVDSAVEETGLEAVAGRLIGHLSRGYQQRVGIAQALLGDPDVLILDEPTVGLDPGQIIEIRQLIRHLGDGNRTVLLSTHILQEVQAVCSRIAIIAKGELRVAGSVTELAERMQSRLRLAAVAPTATLAEALARLPGVEAVHPGVDGGPDAEAVGASSFSLDLQRGTDPRRAIWLLCREHDWPILEMFREQASLEQLFLDVVGTVVGTEEGGQRR